MALITIEGIEGAGKSTLRAHLAAKLAALSREIVVTREPGATDLGQSLRTILLDAKRTELDPLAELLLFFADRAQHLHEVIRPALLRGAIVVCDRYTHSTIAYQGYGRGIPLEPLRALTEFATGGLAPDLVFLLDLDPQQGLERARRRTARASETHSVDEGCEADVSEQGAAEAVDSWNRFEQQQISFHQRVRTGFLELAKDPSNHFRTLDAGMPPEELAELAFQAVKTMINRK